MFVKKMKTMRTLLICLLLLTTSALHAQKSKSHCEVEYAIRESNAVYFESFRKNEGGIFIARYTDDACILAPGSPAACGKDAVAKFFHAAYDHYGLRNGKFTTIAIYYQGGEFATEEGVWESINGEGLVFDKGKYLVLWRKTDHGWKMFRDSFSSDH
jgi:ketosteroid isomerase-like protein